MELNKLLQYLKEYLSYRLSHFLSERQLDIDLPGFRVFSLKSTIGNFFIDHNLNQEEILLVMIALAPHLNPSFFTSIIQEHFPEGGDFPEFGGVKGKNHRGLIPTGETALFILGETDIVKRLEMMKYFEEDHLFAKKGILWVEEPESGEPKMSGRLLMDQEYVDLFTTGKVSKPRLSANFPAERITTQLDWKDLVLQEKMMLEIKEIEDWLNHNETLLNDWGMAGKIKPGFRVLFYGPSGTGKTLTANLLGKYTGRPVFRIDLSMVVSKYIGETEKNLSKLFDKAKNKDWILFFDEADSIFGKRTGVRDAHDKYANQEVSYLLQRIESHPGLVILASNLKSNIDTAFTRRFNLMVEFKNPERKERLALWQNYLPQNINLAKDVDIEEIARNFELTGAGIINVIQRAGLQTLAKEEKEISRTQIIGAIKKEYAKEERFWE